MQLLDSQLKNTLIKEKYLFLAILGHLLLVLLLGVSLRISPTVFQKQKAPQMYVPSYIVQGEPETARPVPVQRETTPVKQEQKSSKGILKKKKVQQKKQMQPPQSKAKKTASGKQSASPKPTPRPTERSRVAEGVNLVGENKVVKPLIELLGRSLGRYLQYPRMAYEFNLKGTSYIGFMLHPSGMVTDVKVIKSSGAEILDNAALKGVQDMSPVQNVSTYVAKPEYLTVGVIFQ